MKFLENFFKATHHLLHTKKFNNFAQIIGRKYQATLNPSKNEIVIMGIDYGARADLEQMANIDKR